MNKVTYYKLPKADLSAFKNDKKVMINSKDKSGEETKLDKLIVESCSKIIEGNNNPYDLKVLQAKAVINQVAMEIIPAKYETDIFEDLSMFAKVKQIGLNEAAKIEDYEIVRSGRAQGQAHGAGGIKQKLVRKDVNVSFDSVTGFVGMDYRALMDDPNGQYERLGQELATQIRNELVSGAEQSLLTGMEAANTAGKVQALYINGLTKATVDFAINQIRSKGRVVKITGGYLPLAEISTFPTSSNSNRPSDRNLEEIEDNGYVGNYNGAALAAYINPFKYGLTQTDTVATVDYKVYEKQLTENTVYVMPGAEAYVPNIAFLRGSITTMMGYDVDNAEETIRADQKRGYYFVDTRTENVVIIRDTNIPE